MKATNKINQRTWLDCRSSSFESGGQQVSKSLLSNSVVWLRHLVKEVADKRAGGTLLASADMHAGCATVV